MSAESYIERRARVQRRVERRTNIADAYEHLASLHRQKAKWLAAERDAPRLSTEQESKFDAAVRGFGIEPCVRDSPDMMGAHADFYDAQARVLRAEIAEAESVLASTEDAHGLQPFEPLPATP
jgi:hypothetical protein